MFLEPFSYNATVPVAVKMPVLSYGTELSEVGFPQCAVAGKDWRQFYKVFSCPRVLVEVKVALGVNKYTSQCGWVLRQARSSPAPGVHLEVKVALDINKYTFQCGWVLRPARQGLEAVLQGSTAPGSSWRSR